MIAQLLPIPTITAEDVLAAYASISGLPRSRRTDLRPATRLASLCDEYGVVPAQVIAYWKRRAADFFPEVAPTLHFLARAEMVIEAKAQRTTARLAPPVGFLDRRVREALRAAGCSSHRWSEQQLIAVQQLAEARIRGHHVFVSRALQPAVFVAQLVLSPR